jgi:hypothetical protein
MDVANPYRTLIQGSAWIYLAYYTVLDSAGLRCGGGGGIRTHERLSPLPIFKTGAFNRSATPPRSANQAYPPIRPRPLLRSLRVSHCRF